MTSQPEAAQRETPHPTTGSSASFHLETFRRLLVLVALCLWFGGFTFYSLVVIHTGHRVFDSRVEVGFLTQSVTGWLNWIGVPTLALLLWNSLCGWKRAPRYVVLLASWIGIAAIELALFGLHPALDHLLDQDTRTILHHDQFRHLHLLYLNLSTAQWLLTLVYAGACLHTWRVGDRNTCVGAPSAN